MDRFVYCDNAATTPVAPEVTEAMLPYFRDIWGNPSALYSVGQNAKTALDRARMSIASLLGCEPGELYFTSCGSESDNWAIKGCAYANANKGRHIVSTVYEHHAVLHSLRALEKAGFEVTQVAPHTDGIVYPEDIAAAMRQDTVLVCCMYANNEIGTINPVADIAETVHARGALFFCDAVQAVGHIPVSIAQTGADMLSFSGHKFNAPKGVGGLYIKRSVRVNNLIDGGGQEKNRRAGTENVPYIVGMAKALELSSAALDCNGRLAALRDRLADGLSAIPYSHINGNMEHRLPGNLNMSFEFVEGESLLLLCDNAGICVSTGSACSSTSLEPSHVLLSIGVPVEMAHGSLRFSLSHENTDADVDYILEKLPPIIDRLRAMSPLYDAHERKC